MLGAGDVGYTIPAEFVYPKYFHKKGALSAARQGDECESGEGVIRLPVLHRDRKGVSMTRRFSSMEQQMNQSTAELRLSTLWRRST